MPGAARETIAEEAVEQAATGSGAAPEPANRSRTVRAAVHCV